VSLHRLLDDARADAAGERLRRCCGSTRWVNGMLARRPFLSDEALLRAADEVWAEAGPVDVLEALSHHPRIGASLEELRRRYASTADWSAGEQAGAAEAGEETLRALRDGNLAYEARFGHVFVVCATGKSAAEMLALLRERMSNDPWTELRAAAAEQAKITRLRIQKLS
jgi:2-oxo-4-hydroxy-4-carboxy-5-ureidoimidazoline decarboxylase